jgi:hypothetical protein
MQFLKSITFEKNDMLKLNFLIALFCVPAFAFSQKVEIDYDKERDFSGYTTFSVGEGEIFTPESDRTYDEKELRGWIRTVLVRELTEKGLKQQDAGADLHLDFVVGKLQQSEFEDWGPMGYSQSPDPMGQGSSRTWSNQHSQGSVFLDIIDTKLNKVVWKCTASVNLVEGTDIDRLINELATKAFRKFPPKSKKKKK